MLQSKTTFLWSIAIRQKDKNGSTDGEGPLDLYLVLFSKRERGEKENKEKKKTGKQLIALYRICSLAESA